VKRIGRIWSRWCRDCGRFEEWSDSGFCDRGPVWRSTWAIRLFGLFRGAAKKRRIDLYGFLLKKRWS